MFAVSPRVLQYAIDDLYIGVTRTKLASYGGLLLLIAGLAGYFRYQMRRIIISASRGVEYDLRNDFFAHLERLPMSFFQQNRTGDLMSRATNDLSSVRMMIGPAIMYLANTLITAVVSLSLMFSLDVRLTLIVLLPLPIVSITVKMFGTAIHKTFEEVQEKLSDMSAVVQESLTGVRVVRAYGQEQRGDRALPRVEYRLSATQQTTQPPAGGFLPDDVAVPRDQRAAGVVAGEPGCHARTPDGGRARRIQRVPRAAGVADDRIRLGHEPARARHGVVEADADGDGCEPGHTR